MANKRLLIQSVLRTANRSTTDGRLLVNHSVREPLSACILLVERLASNFPSKSWYWL